MTERCERTELLVDACACPVHRGGQAPGEEPVRTVGQPFDALYPSPCARGCDRGIRPGDDIARCREAADGYVHAGRCP